MKWQSSNHRMPRLEVVMTTVSDTLVETSLSAMLAAIEIYNKPDFKYREQVFTILVVNAWELLLKARILHSAGDDVTSLYVRQKDGTVKCNRNGEPLTIELTRAIQVIVVDAVVQRNLLALIDVRDTAVHLYHSDPISYLVYTLGVAALKNYQKLMKDWFGRSLLEYNFYILPVGFAYNFLHISMLELDKGPEAVAHLITSVAATQASLNGQSEFHFVCEIGVEMRTARHFPTGADLTINTGSDRDETYGALVIHRPVHLIDQYPYSYTELRQRVKKELPHVKQGQIDAIIRKYDIKKNIRMSAYSFPTKKHALEYEKNGTKSNSIASLYNGEAVQFIIEQLKVNHSA
jgi:hypothetical protein